MLFVCPIAFAFPKEAVDLNLTYSADSIELAQDSLHTVKKGETLYSIAKSKETTVALLKAWNNLTNSEIQAGQTIRILSPNKEEIILSEETPKLAEVVLEDSVHVVEKGEYISGIAEKYNLEIKDISIWNKLTSPDRIYPGQELKLYPVENIPIDSLRVTKEIPVVKDSLIGKTISIQTTSKSDTTAISGEKPRQQDTAVNSNLSYDFNPGGVKTLLNVLVLVL